MAWPAEASRLRPVRLAILPIGAFRFQKGQMASGTHIGPEHALQFFEPLAAATSIHVHRGTFRMSYEKRETPPTTLEMVLQLEEKKGQNLAQLRIGERRTIVEVKRV